MNSSGGQVGGVKMKCPECGKAHRKWPRDCCYWASVNKIIADDPKRLNAMRQYVTETKIPPPENPQA